MMAHRRSTPPRHASSPPGHRRCPPQGHSGGFIPYAAICQPRTLPCTGCVRPMHGLTGCTRDRDIRWGIQVGKYTPFTCPCTYRHIYLYTVHTYIIHYPPGRLHCPPQGHSGGFIYTVCSYRMYVAWPDFELASHCFIALSPCALACMRTPS